MYRYLVFNCPCNAENLYIVPHYFLDIMMMQVGYFSLLALSLGARVIAIEPAMHMIP